MSLRPRPARWFEILTTNEDLSLTLETLAGTGDVELEARSETTHPMQVPDLHDRLEEYNRLARRYLPYWPHPQVETPGKPGRFKDKLDQALERLYAWQQQADPLIQQMETLHNEQTELTLLHSALQQFGDQTLDFTLLAQAGPTLAARLFVLPVTLQVHQLPPALLSLQAVSPLHRFLLVVSTLDEVDGLQRELTLKKGRSVSLPDDLTGNTHQAGEQVSRRLSHIDQTLAEFRNQLATFNERHDIGTALRDIQQVEWFLTHVSELPVTENFAWITGWTRDLSGDHLGKALTQAKVRAVVNFPAAPVNSNPPMVIHNPWWAQPFELFARLLGTPAANETDPSRLLALIVPLLFGYMFGDVGHGLVLVIAGLLFAGRWPMLRLLTICGISSIIFGWVFGSLFGNEDIIDALWVHPIHEPLTVLLAALIGGAVIILLGLMLNSIQAYWRGELRHWLMIDAAVIVMYLAIITSFLSVWSALVFGLALAWFFAGHLVLAKGHYLRILGQALGQLLESLFQLIVNTFSFIRVGAFALAHAGLSLAFISLADASDNLLLSGFILLIGNVIVILLEGLVVSIQTTRLVLFEFFIRFLQGTGRLFRPLTGPGNPAHPESRHDGYQPNKRRST